MKSTFSSLLLCTLMVLLTASAPSEKGWTNLLDKKLSQWEMYLGFRHKNDFKGDAPKDENGNLIQPVGYNKNENNVFTVIEENGEPVLRISGEIYGCVYTKQDYENYHLKLKVKWGNKNWEPRIEKLKDSGILYHSIGEAGVDYWKAWMLSQEFQIMEGHVGDYWAIANSAIDIRAFIPEGQMNPVASQKRAFIPIGEGSSFGGFCLRSEDY
ncbi:MAG TPA: family 16 glycoside hydrolase, partial [Chryseolinea sp.]|nr:family 16 glycoside hydrolase [Chryseolinea sp.]